MPFAAVILQLSPSILPDAEVLEQPDARNTRRRRSWPGSSRKSFRQLDTRFVFARSKSNNVRFSVWSGMAG